LVELFVSDTINKTKRRGIKPDRVSGNCYLGQFAESLIGAVLLGVANGDIITADGSELDRLDGLIYIYKYVPINPRYALYGLAKFLETKLRNIGVSFKDMNLKERIDARRAPDKSAQV
jgi:hypothetical protein